MRKRFTLDTVSFNTPKGTTNKMVFTAYDTTNKKFVEMLLEPQQIKTYKKEGLNASNKVIEGEIIEITKYE